MQSTCFLAFLLSIISANILLCQNFEEVNFPIIVDGIELQHGFLGGITNPQFSNIDLDRDGVLDLFVFDRNGNRVYTFLQKGENGISAFEHHPEYESLFPNLNFWVLLIDYNGDGIEDIFTAPQERDESGITVYKGSLTSNFWNFTRVTFADELDILHYEYQNLDTGETDREKIFVAHNSDIPAISDIDYDGDIDILSFESTGSYLLYYKNYTVERNLGLNNFAFELADDCWGKFQESGNGDSIIISSNNNHCANGFVGHEEPIATVRHSGSSISLFDSDGDGDKDAIIGDIGSRNIVYLENEGNKDDAYVTTANYNFPNPQKIDQFLYPSTFFVDINNDGNRDLISSVNSKEIGINKNHIWYYKNTNSDDSPIFELIQKDFLADQTINIGRYTAPTFVDYNSDGLMDILVGNSGYIIDEEIKELGMHLFKNIGTSSQPIFELIDKDYLELSSLIGSNERIAPTFGDLDNDGDLDLLIGDQHGRLCYFENHGGTGQPMDFNEFIYPYFDIKVGINSIPQLIDINNDGLMDIVSGENNNNQTNGIFGSLNYFQNIGTEDNPQFNSDQTMEPNSEILGQVYFEGDYSNSPFFYKKDDTSILFTGSFSGNIRVFENTINAQEPFELKADSIGGINIGNNSIITLYDIDNDNYLELLIGNARGGLDFYNTPYSIEGIDTPVTEAAEELVAKIYPNPISNNFHIQSNQNIAKIILYDMTGKIVRIWQEPQKIYSIKNCPKGLHYLSVMTLDNSTKIILVSIK